MYDNATKVQAITTAASSCDRLKIWRAMRRPQYATGRCGGSFCDVVAPLGGLFSKAFDVQLREIWGKAGF